MTLIVRNRIKIMIAAMITVLAITMVLDEDCNGGVGSRYVGSSVSSTR